METHFDVQNGYPKDPTVLSENDVALLTGGQQTWTLDYKFLDKLPSFVGLFVGNLFFCFWIYWAAWFVVL